jgi:hypothetical protein
MTVLSNEKERQYSSVKGISSSAKKILINDQNFEDHTNLLIAHG